MIDNPLETDETMQEPTGPKKPVVRATPDTPNVNLDAELGLTQAPHPNSGANVNLDHELGLGAASHANVDLDTELGISPPTSFQHLARVRLARGLPVYSPAGEI